MAREAMHTATERWYLTKNDKAIRAANVGKLSAEERAGIKLLVGPGSAIPLKTAEHYGLIAQPEPEPVASRWDDAVDGAKSELEEPPEGLDSKSKAELIELAEAKGVEVKSAMTKADLIEAIQATE